MPGEHGGGDDRPLTAADLAPFTQALNELRQRFDDLDEAETPAERREARQDVEDAEEDLAATAKRLGVSEAKLRESIKAARDAERKEELRPLLAELLAEQREQEEAEPEAEETTAVPKTKKTTKKKEPAADAEDGTLEPKEPVVDTEPVKPHWSESSIATLIR